jgi:SAM-dependent methyltransferase
MAEPNSAQRAGWNGDSGERWVSDADRRDRVLEPVLDALLSAARIQERENVLDIGCGCGAATLAAAVRLTAGQATGVDLSRPMLDLARQRAGKCSHVTFVEADAQTCAFESGTDVVISRFGTMFFDDPVAAFANIRRGVKDQGRLCVATWGPLLANEWLLVPGAALLKYTANPPTDEPGPGMFSQSDPDQVRMMLSAAGWRNARVEPCEVVLRIGSDIADAVDYLADQGIARRVLDTIAPPHRPRALEEVATALTGHVSDGVCLKASINMIHASA